MSRQSRKRPSKARKRLHQNDVPLMRMFCNALLNLVQKELNDAKHGMYKGKPLPPLSEDDHLFM